MRENSPPPWGQGKRGGFVSDLHADFTARGNITQFRRPRTNCHCCGLAFIPLRAEHELCRRCYSWTRAALHAGRLDAALTEARRGGFYGR